MRAYHSFLMSNSRCLSEYDDVNAGMHIVCSASIKAVVMGGGGGSRIERNITWNMINIINYFFTNSAKTGQLDDHQYGHSLTILIDQLSY